MAHPPVPVERRQRHRASVHWKVRAQRALSEPPLESTTENVSSGGFYCFFQDALQCGEKLSCWLAIPTQGVAGADTLILRCQAVVVHVEHIADCFGAGFRIDEFSVLRDGDHLPDFLQL